MHLIDVTIVEPLQSGALEGKRPLLVVAFLGFMVGYLSHGPADSSQPRESGF